MKKIGFIGAYDKTDFLLYVAKILVEMGNNVLVVDGTITQKARYIVPTIEPSKAYVTNYEGIDIAVGLKSLEEVKAYLGIPEINELPYTMVLIDTDTTAGVISYNIENCEKIYFVTSFDMYSIRRGMESISGIQVPIVATRILFSREEITKGDNDYLNYLSAGSMIRWDSEVVLLPFELGDQTVIYNNQRVSKIKLKGLTSQYKEGLMYVTSQITGEEDYKTLKKLFKKIERGV